MEAVAWTARCAAHPEGGTHECLEAERRCAYCGAVIEPYCCHGCGQFLTAQTMHLDCSRCEECE